MAILGDTIEEIAEQKAGIIKRGAATVVYPDNQPEVFHILQRAAEIKNSEFIIPDEHKLKVVYYGLPGGRFKYRGRRYDIKMAGRHQIINAITAIETLDYLRRIGFKGIKYSFVYEGLRGAYLVSRCQIIQDKPLIILDGAHNPDSMRKLAEFIRQLSDKPKIMIVGMREDKDFDTTLSEISRYIDTALCIDGFMPGTIGSDKLSALFTHALTVSVYEALRLAISLAGENGMVVIAGSLYLAEALSKYTQ
jgi:dihydrofolate synthase/folylpolyglutamate synthase